MIRFLDVDHFSKGLTPVTSTSYITRTGEFDSLGLFSETIFGSLGSLDRKTKFSYIDLHCYVIHPAAYKLLIQLNRKVEKFISTEDLFILDKNGFLEESPNGVTGITEFIKLFPKIKWRGDTEERTKIIKLLENTFKIKRLFINKIPVLPVEARPITQDRDTKQWIIEELNEYYLKIMRQSLSMRSSGGKGPLYDLLNYGVQKAVIDHDEYIREKIGSKAGLIRSQLMGKRVDFSGRGVIIPGPNLAVNEIGVPMKLAVSLFQPFIIHELLYTNKFDKNVLNDEINRFLGVSVSVSSIQKVLKVIEKGSSIPETLYEIIRQATENSMANRVVLAKRDPVLHIQGIQAFIPILTDGNAIQLSTLVTGGFNADFDGDQMALFHPLSKEAQEEARKRMMRGKGISTSTSLTFEFSKEMCVGLYILTKNTKSTASPIKPMPEDLEKATDPYVPVIFKGKHTTMGKAIINSCFPDDFRFIDSLLDKGTANSLLSEITEKYDQEIAYKAASKMKNYAFKFATIVAPSFSISDVQMPPKMYQLKKKLEKASQEEALPILEEMKQLMIETLKGSGFYDLCESGASKGWDQPFQMLCAKGIIADPEGNILPIIKGAFSDGLTVEEYFNATSGARKGIIDRVLNTADTGYTSRQLIYLLNSVELDWFLKDCKTQNYLELKLTSDIMKRLTGRYVIEKGHVELFDKTKYKIGDMIKLRSPVFCKSLKMCHTCYGKLLERHKTPYIGIISAQTIGERGTQLIMRSIHTGGTVKVQVKKILSDIAENDPETEL